MTYGPSLPSLLPNRSTRCRRIFSRRYPSEWQTSRVFSREIHTSSRDAARCLSTHSRPFSHRSCSSTSSTLTSWRSSTSASTSRSMPRGSCRTTSSTPDSRDLRRCTATNITTPPASTTRLPTGQTRLLTGQTRLPTGPATSTIRIRTTLSSPARTGTINRTGMIHRTDSINRTRTISIIMARLLTEDLVL